jgi:hypothetical protein
MFDSMKEMGMSNRAILPGVLALLLCAAAQGDKPKSIKEIMNQTHKGKDSMVQKVISGKGTPEDHQKLLDMYQFMAAQKPPMGDDSSWKSKTSALITASMDLVSKKSGAADEFKKAVDCKSCHTAHKPKQQ